MTTGCLSYAAFRQVHTDNWFWSVPVLLAALFVHGTIGSFMGGAACHEMSHKTPFKNWVADVAYFPERYGDTVIPLLLSLIDGQAKPKQVFVNHRVVTPANLTSIYPGACK